MPEPNQTQGSATNPPKPTQVVAPKTNPSTGRREVPVPSPAPVDQEKLTVAVAAALADMDRQRAASTSTPDMDETVPGGVYLVDGRLVDCNGDPRELPKPDDSEEA